MNFLVAGTFTDSLARLTGEERQLPVACLNPGSEFVEGFLDR